MSPRALVRTRSALAQLLALLLLALAPAAALAQDDDEPLLDLDDEEDAEDDAEAETEAEAEESTGDDEAAEAEPSEGEGAAADEPSTDRWLALHIAAGFGAGTLSFRRPIENRAQRLPQSAFAAADLEVRLHAYPDDDVSLDMRLIYQTSLGLTVQRPMLFALPQNISVRTQYVALSAAPVVRLGASDGPALAFPIGFGFQAFTPEVDQYGVSEYSFGGPFVRAELWLQLGSDIGLRLGPEVQWLVLIDDALRRENVCCQGLSVGGQGTIEARVGTVLRVALAYREARASVPGVRNGFENVERFLTARFGGEL